MPVYKVPITIVINDVYDHVEAASEDAAVEEVRRREKKNGTSRRTLTVGTPEINNNYPQFDHPAEPDGEPQGSMSTCKVCGYQIVKVWDDRPGWDHSV